MLGYQRGLEVISNDVSNISTPGFRGSDVNFSDLFGGAPIDGHPGDQLLGAGVDSSQVLLNTAAGTQQTTGRDLDLALGGPGFFVVQSADGSIGYTRNGSFEFDTANNLVLRGQPIKVMSMDSNGRLASLDIGALLSNPAKPTGTITFAGNMSPNDPDFTINSVTVIDQSGQSHVAQVVLTKNTTLPPIGSQTTWDVAVLENGVTLGSGQVQFDQFGPAPGSETVPLTLSFISGKPLSVTLDFKGATGQVTGGTIPPGGPGDPNRNSSMSVSKQDGLAKGTISSEKFDAKGVLQITYTNGQTATGPTLALANIVDQSGLIELGNSLFSYQGKSPVQFRRAGEDLQILSQKLEGSNVDLTTEFSKIILMQRGYQAASEVISTSNELMQQLLQMKGGR